VGQDVAVCKVFEPEYVETRRGEEEEEKGENMQPLTAPQQVRAFHLSLPDPEARVQA
jgi:hypothetical protein